MLSMACFGASRQQANIATAPMIAMAGRSIFVPGSLPMAKTR